MKLFVKKLNSNDMGFTVTVGDEETIAHLKQKIGETLDIAPEAMRLLYLGLPLSNTTATLRSYGIEDGGRINVVYTPVVDLTTTVAKALRTLLHDCCPPSALPQITEQYQNSLAKRINSFTLEELERYAKFRNSEKYASEM